MSTTFRPNEAKEDSYALGIITALMMSLVTIFFAYSTYHSGLKYMVLTLYGIETQSSVISARNLGILSAQERLDLGISIDSGYNENIREVTLKFFDLDDKEITSFFLVPRQQSVPQQDDNLQVLYARFDSNIVLPVQFLPAYRTDAKILAIAVGIIFICAVSIAIIVRRWHTFRLRARRY